jgi:hypothetical protein
MTSIDRPKKRTYCQNCGKSKQKDGVAQLMSCGKCKLTVYCSKECQRTNWKEHRLLCKDIVKVNEQFQNMDFSGPPPPNPFPNFNIPPGTTTRKRAYEMDFDNMTPADWARLEEINYRIDLLNSTYSSFDHLSNIKPKKRRCVDLLKDIDKHWDDYWYVTF